MGQNQKKIIAIGGGGFTHKSDEVLDKFVIDQCKKNKLILVFYQLLAKIIKIK